MQSGGAHPFTRSEGLVCSACARLPKTGVTYHFAYYVKARVHNIAGGEHTNPLR